MRNSQIVLISHLRYDVPLAGCPRMGYSRQDSQEFMVEGVRRGMNDPFLELSLWDEAVKCHGLPTSTDCCQRCRILQPTQANIAITAKGRNSET